MLVYECFKKTVNTSSFRHCVLLVAFSLIRVMRWMHQEELCQEQWIVLKW